jgi:hypothetical protein
MMLIFGDFGLVSPAGLLQLLAQEQRSVRLEAWHSEDKVCIDLVEGLIVAASCGDQQAEEAVYAFAAWSEGRFEVSPLEHIPDAVEVVGSCEELLLEAARRRDEFA